MHLKLLQSCWDKDLQSDNTANDFEDVYTALRFSPTTDFCKVSLGSTTTAFGRTCETLEVRESSADAFQRSNYLRVTHSALSSNIFSPSGLAWNTLLLVKDHKSDDKFPNPQTCSRSYVIGEFFEKNSRKSNKGRNQSSLHNHKITNKSKLLALPPRLCRHRARKSH